MPAVDLRNPTVLPRIVNTTLGLANIVRVVLIPSGPGWSVSIQPVATAAKLADASNALTEGGALGTADVVTLQTDFLTVVDLSASTNGTLYLASATPGQVVEIALDRE